MSARAKVDASLLRAEGDVGRRSLHFWEHVDRGGLVAPFGVLLVADLFDLEAHGDVCRDEQGHLAVPEWAEGDECGSAGGGFDDLLLKCGHVYIGWQMELLAVDAQPGDQHGMDDRDAVKR